MIAHFKSGKHFLHIKPLLDKYLALHDKILNLLKFKHSKCIWGNGFPMKSYSLDKIFGNTERCTYMLPAMRKI